MSPVMMEMNYEERPRRLSGTKRDSRELDGEDIRQAVADHDNKVAEMNFEGVRKGSLKAKASVFNRARRESQEDLLSKSIAPYWEAYTAPNGRVYGSKTEALASRAPEEVKCSARQKALKR